MKPDEYIRAVLNTESNDWDAIEFRTIATLRLDHALKGMVTEVGELVDQLKKHVYYGRKLDYVNIKEELGDLCWYIGIALDFAGLSWEQIWETNIAKLRLRYPEKFNEQKAENRNLEAERALLEFDSTKPKASKAIDGSLAKDGRDLLERVNPSYNKGCPACIEKKQHSKMQWEVFHPHAGEGFSREHGTPKPEGYTGLEEGKK